MSELRVTASVSKVTNRQSLIQSKDYVVIGVYDLNYRIIDESGEPALYPKSFFLDADFDLPKNWVFRDFGDGGFACSPPELSQRGFYEDYADGNPVAIAAFKSYRGKILGMGSS